MATRTPLLRLNSVFSGRRKRILRQVVPFVAALAGLLLLRAVMGASFAVTAEAENGAVTGAAVKQSGESGASAGGSVRFGVSTATPSFSEQVLVSGKDHIWDAVQLSDGSLLFAERNGKVSLYKSGSVSALATISDVRAVNLGGLMGLAIDPQYESNKYIYACMNSTAGDVRVVRWAYSGNGLQDRHDIVTGIPAITGDYHSGCRLNFGADGNLWVGTGDATFFGNAQDPTTMGGKVLHVTRDGAAAPGNQGGSFDPRVFNYGHRNIQGMAMFRSPKNGVYGLSVEHGPDADDEVNELRNGNFGYAPVASGSASYQEVEVQTPMTDLNRFPNAVSAIWKSGTPTQAPSGATIIYGAQWKGWDGAVAVAMLKATHLKILRLDATNKVIKEEKVLNGTYGRLRTAILGNDGNLYVTTDNGGDDKIIRLTPQ